LARDELAEVGMSHRHVLDEEALALAVGANPISAGFGFISA